MDPYEKPKQIDADVVANLGPLAPLVGNWAGDEGVDISPSRTGPAETAFRERITFEPVGPVVNGPQVLYGLRYTTTAWPIGEDDAFHEEVGYWLWCRQAGVAMRCFMVPRGVTILAGGEAAAGASRFEMKADVGSETFGILSNPFLDEAFKTVHYEVEISIHEDGSFSYAEDTVLKIAGAEGVFHHTDRNRLTRE